MKRKVVSIEHRHRQTVNADFVKGTYTIRSRGFAHCKLDCGHMVVLRGARDFKTANCKECR